MERLGAGEPVSAGAVTVVPLERSVLSPVRSDLGPWLSGSKEPVAIVVRDPSGIRAFDLDGMEVPLAPLMDEVPALREILR